MTLNDSAIILLSEIEIFLKLIVDDIEMLINPFRYSKVKSIS